MDIEFAILGLLSWRSFSGYDLKKIIAESDLFYWSGNNNQIYNSLVHLHQLGLVTQQVQPQESLPAKKVYSISAAGQAELRQRLLAAPELPELHNHFMIQLAWAEALSDAELDALLGQYEEEIAVQLRMRLAAAEREQAANAAPHRSAREQLVWQKISAGLTDTYRRELAWVRDLRQSLREQQDQAGA